MRVYAVRLLALQSVDFKGAFDGHYYRSELNFLLIPILWRMKSSDMVIANWRRSILS